MVLPSESEGAAHRHHQFERPDTVFPAKRLHPDAMAELAEAELVWLCGWIYVYKYRLGQWKV